MILPYILTPEAKVPAADRLRAMFNDDKVRIVPELADCMGRNERLRGHHGFQR